MCCCGLMQRTRVCMWLARSTPSVGPLSLGVIYISQAPNSCGGFATWFRRENLRENHEKNFPVLANCSGFDKLGRFQKSGSREHSGNQAVCIWHSRIGGSLRIYEGDGKRRFYRGKGLRL